MKRPAWSKATLAWSNRVVTIISPWPSSGVQAPAQAGGAKQKRPKAQAQESRPSAKAPPARSSRIGEGIAARSRPSVVRYNPTETRAARLMQTSANRTFARLSGKEFRELSGRCNSTTIAAAMVRIEERRSGARAIVMIAGLAPARATGVGGGGHQADDGEGRDQHHRKFQTFHFGLQNRLRTPPSGAHGKPTAELTKGCNDLAAAP